ncbi:hypothetical protein HY643_00810 [Candidatus Woesearchaeota archaeon]|nr:hypothetical protein [Candidatus Woesearchaeota archaeon]
MGKDKEQLLTMLKFGAYIAGAKIKKAGKATYEATKEAYQEAAEELPDNMSTGEKAGSVAGKILGRQIEGLAKLAKIGVNAGKKYLEDKEIIAQQNTNPIRCYEASFKEQPKEYSISNGDNLILKVTEEFTPGKFYAVVNHSEKGVDALLTTYGIQLGKEIPLENYLQLIEQEKKVEEKPAKKETKGKKRKK